VQEEGDLVDMCIRITLSHLVKLLQFDGTKALSDKHSRRGSNLARFRDAQLSKMKGFRSALLESVANLAHALQSFGAALAASVPSRFGCNWPGCVRLSV
jgi:hypothetical protein